MASYSSPTANEIQKRCGLSDYIEALGEFNLEAKLLALRADAEAETALNVGEAIFGSDDLTTLQAQALKSAVCLRAGAMYLRSPMVQVATGSQEPLLMEESTNLRQLALDMEGKAEELELKVYTVITQATEEEDETPSFGGSGLFLSSTYSPDSLSVMPSERIRRQSERQDLPAGSESA